MIRRWGVSLAAPAIGVALIVGCSQTDDDASVETAPTSAADESKVDESTNDQSTTNQTVTSDEGGGCEIGPVPASAGLDPFYTQGCRIDGFWVVAHDVVDPVAIVRAADTVDRIFTADDQLAATLADTGIRLGVIGRHQRTTEMPEYRDLNEAFPETDWDERARGLGATLERPLVSAGEENILCLADDRYLGEDILLHEFSHVLHEFGYNALDPGFDDDLFAAYRQAVGEGTWSDTYAETNHHEYWAEGVQSYFGRNLTADPADGVHGPIDTRSELEAADPALHALIDGRLGAVELPPQCR